MSLCCGKGAAGSTGLRLGQPGHGRKGCQGLTLHGGVFLGAPGAATAWLAYPSQQVPRGVPSPHEFPVHAEAPRGLTAVGARPRGELTAFLVLWAAFGLSPAPLATSQRDWRERVLSAPAPADLCSSPQTHAPLLIPLWPLCPRDWRSSLGLFF